MYGFWPYMGLFHSERGKCSMNSGMTIFLFAIGVVLVIKGGDLFVDAASWIAERSGIPKLIIGATVVSLATTMPEMLVSVMAAAQGKVDMSIGNAVGSVTANIGLIMALALLCMPGAIRRRDYLLKSILMLTAAALTAACGLAGAVRLPASLALLAVFAVFLWENLREARRAGTPGAADGKADVPAGSAAPASQIPAEGDRPAPARRAVMVQALKFVCGAAGIIAGAQLLVDNGSALARLAGVPERVIGVTLVAVGTSLPELVTTITAIVKKQSALSVGNILGANIIDLTLIMPLASLISGKALPISAAFARVDLPVCLLVALIAMVPALVRSRFSRWQGAALLGVYAAYLVITCTVV